MAKLGTLGGKIRDRVAILGTHTKNAFYFIINICLLVGRAGVIGLLENMPQDISDSKKFTSFCSE